ncbi:hypothetical protein SYN63AY4M1_08285 [Synechococcus sp. 63AY4M1]|nr:hypothetical protein SYN63AY4M1_08285 [Synechococcus sp. 63AY4M1]
MGDGAAANSGDKRGVGVGVGLATGTDVGVERGAGVGGGRRLASAAAITAASFKRGTVRGSRTPREEEALPAVVTGEETPDRARWPKR